MSRRRVTRRVFLRSGSLALFASGAAPRFLDRLAWAQDGASERRRSRDAVLVSIFLRGAMDGLMAVPPLAQEATLRRLRPRLAMSAARSGGGGVIDLDGAFGMHAALSPLLPLWRDGRLAIVHAVGSPNPTRSHFDAQDYMETGTPFSKGTPSGWLNRVAGRAALGRSPWQVVSLTPVLPRSLYGDAPALALPDLEQFHLPVGDPRLAERLEVLYTGSPDGLLRERGGDLFAAMRLLAPQEIAAYRQRSGAAYPRSQLGQSLLQIAYLIKAGVGLRIACAESDGWDTHVAQGAADGRFARQAADLAASLAAFWEDLDELQQDVVVLTMTEFGRTVEENGSGGTDHGHGSCLLALGNRVDGGRVYGSLPALEAEALFEGRDLPVTTDFRAVLAEVAGRLFAVDDDEAVFPGWSGVRLPILW